MAESLEDVKNRLRESFVGKGGIHGVGLSRSKQAIRVYIHPDDNANRAALLDQVQKSAQPFPVIVVKEERPQIT